MDEGLLTVAFYDVVKIASAVVREAGRNLGALPQVLGSWIRGVQGTVDRRLQWRQIDRQRVPYRFEIDAVILVTEPVPNSTNIAPR